MKRSAILAIIALALAGCQTAPEKVLFVTDTALGINYNGNPTTLALGYDRNEAYLAGRRPDGSIPPVVGFFESGGDVFNPEVRQFYATGYAAVKAVDATAPSPAPQTPAPPAQAETASQRMAVFGTTTSLGLKVGFGAQPYPDSFIFGYKRKEMSWIPVTSATDDATQKHVSITPSVLAVIDSTIATKASAAGTGLTLRQFFATGAPADGLAATEGKMLVKAARVAAREVTQGGKIWEDNVIAADAVGTAITKADGSVDTPRLTCLVRAANAANATLGIPLALAQQTDPKRIKSALDGSPTIAPALAAQLPNCP